MPARVLLKNYEWIAWTGGEPGKGEPYYKQGDVLLVADKPGQRWRTPDVPELDGKISSCPDSTLDDWLAGVPVEMSANRMLKEIAERNPNFVVLEFFEEPDWKPQPLPLEDEQGNLIVY